MGGHVSPWRWKHRFIEVGSANNYSLSNADRAVLNSEGLSKRKSEGSGIQDAIPGISLGKLQRGSGLLADLLIDMNILAMILKLLFK